MALNFQNNSPQPLGRAPFIVALVVSMVCLGIYNAEGAAGPLHSVQAAVEGMIAPLQLAGAPLGVAVEDAEKASDENAATEETLAALREQNEQLTQRSVQGEEYRLEVERLQALLGLRDAYDIQGPTGRVIGRSTDAWNQDITLDVGSNEGVESGLTVVGASGVIGQVISVTPGTCRVRLLSDPQSGAAAMIQASRAEGIVRGSLDGLLYLENIGADVNIQVGDVVLTSGLGGSYTRGLLIGTVARVEGSAGKDTRKIVVAPNGSVSLMEEAIVVLSAASDAADRAVVSSEGAEGDVAGEDGAADAPDGTGAAGGDASPADSGDGDAGVGDGDADGEGDA